MNWNDFRLFVQLVDHRSFSAAARALKVPKSTLSHRMIRLEESLGARLIHRTSRSFAMTAVGEDFYRHAAAMLIEAEAAEDAVTRRLAEPAGIVRVTSSVGTSHSGLSDVLVQFSLRFRKVVLHHHATNRNVDLIDERFDIAVRAHQGALSDSTLIQRRLGFSPRWAVASPSYLESSGTPEAPSDLTAHKGLSLAPMARENRWVLQDSGGQQADVNISLQLVSDDFQSLRTAACRGLGIAVLPAGFCRPDVEKGELVRVLPDWIVGGADISILTPHRRGQLPSLRSLADYIAQTLPTSMGLVLSRKA